MGNDNRMNTRRASGNRKGDRSRIHNITEDVSSGTLAKAQEQEALRQQQEEDRRRAKRRHQQSLQRRQKIRRRRKIRRFLLICLLIVIVIAAFFAIRTIAHFNTGSRHDDRGMSAYEDGDYDTAVQEFKEAISYNEQDANYYIHLSMAYIEKGSFEEALGYFSQAESCAEDDKQRCLISRGRAIAYSGEGLYPEAIEACGEALEYAGEKDKDLRVDILYYQADAQTKKGDYSGAAQAYTDIYDATGDDGALMMRGRVYSMLGEYESAEEDLRAAIKGNRRSYGIYLKLYDVLQEQGKTEEARQVLEDALTLSGSSGEDHYYRGMIYLTIGDLESAQEMLDTSYNKGYKAALIGQSALAAEKGDYETALSVCEQFLKEGSDSDSELLTKAYNQYAVCLLHEERWEDAAAACQEGISIGSRDTDQALRSNLVAAYEYMNDWDSAYAAAKTLYERYPGDAAAEKEFHFLESRVLN